MCPHLVFQSFNNVLVAFGSLSKSSILVRTSIGPFRCFLYLGILLTETAASSEKLPQRIALERGHVGFTSSREI